MDPRQTLEVMIRTDRSSMTVWSMDEVRHALDAYRDQVLTEAAELIQSHVNATAAAIGLNTANGMARAANLLLAARATQES